MNTYTVTFRDTAHGWIKFQADKINVEEYWTTFLILGENILKNKVVYRVASNEILHVQTTHSE